MGLTTEEASPSVRLRTTLEALYDDYLRRWGAHEENRLYMDIAEAFRPSVHSLAFTPELIARIRVLHEEVGTPAVLNDLPAFVQALTSHPIVRDGVEIRIAYDALAKLSGAEGRLAVILSLISSRRLSPRAERFLARVTHLYLWGLEPETVVMCGATLEAAYQERFSDLEMFRLQIKKEGRWFESHHYEHAARTLGIFSTTQHQLAAAIRNARNTLVHEDPTVPAQPQRVLEGVTELLACLFPSAPPQSQSEDR